MTSPLDPVELSQQLIRCPSVTPVDEGALDVLQGVLEGLGFICHRLPFSEEGTPDVDNLYARLGTGAPNFCFAGHTDVVPVGDESAWSVDPFAAEIVGDRLIGRGASDMKCAIACFAAAVAAYIEERGDGVKGSISFLITGDEEGPAINGTVKMLDWLKERGETIDACLVGEPTNPKALGEMVKIGRRGSLNGYVTVKGVQGHVAYPDLAQNPVPVMLNKLAALQNEKLDDGNEHFPPSNLEITTVDVGNPTTNLIPAEVKATFNIRFNDTYSGATLADWINARLNAVDGDHEIEIKVSGESFITPPGPLSDILTRAVEQVTGRTPELSTTGGTSDARFIKDMSPVIEFGLANETAHKVDEFAYVADIRALADIYKVVLDLYFEGR